MHSLGRLAFVAGIFALSLGGQCGDYGLLHMANASDTVLRRASHPRHNDGTPIMWWSHPIPNGRNTEDLAALPPLTPRAQGFRRVIMFGMVGGICRHDDWRGDLPQYLMRYLPEARAISLLLIPNYQDMSQDPSTRCAECTMNGKAIWDHNRLCEHYLGKTDVTHPADLIILVGSGRLERWPGATGTDRWPDMHNLFNSSYMSKDTMVVHLPVRKGKELRTLFPADAVVQDEDFVKPLSVESYEQMKGMCPQQTKINILLYVGRYKPAKGQLAFLQAVDPRDLEGYVVHFYGSDINASKGDYYKELEALAMQRGISIVLHEPVPKQAVLRQYCRAAGIIHYSSGDNNPRVLYEALYGEIPVFTTPETLLSDTMYEQEFVTSVGATKPEEFHDAFRRFMGQVKDSDRWRPVIREFVDNVLNPDNVYRRLCVKMGICAAESKTGASLIPVS